MADDATPGLIPIGALARLTGVMTAHVRDVEHLEAVIDQFAAYGQTTSAIMQSAPVPRRGLSLLPEG